jgi:endonuclease/exonuclease/phosphatase family metal-dependent hydrolase
MTLQKLLLWGLLGYVSALPPLCPPPPYDDDVHLSCAVEHGSYATTSQNIDMSLINIVEYNIDRNGFGGDGSKESGLDSIIDLLTNQSLVPFAHMFVMSEVARGCKNYGGVDFSGAREIAESMSLNYYYAVEYVDIDQSTAEDECSMGNAILSRFEIRDVAQLRFESQCCRYGGRYGGRIDLIGDIIVPFPSDSKRLHIHSAHLESGQANPQMVMESLVVREQQAAEMAAATYATSGHVIIGGDLNSPLPRVDPTILKLEKEGFVNSFENKTVGQREVIQLDYLFSSPSVLVNAGYCDVPECEGYSDHVPYWATIDFS